VIQHNRSLKSFVQLFVFFMLLSEDVSRSVSSKQACESLQGVGKARANQAVRIARGSDGTRGFTAALQPGGRARLLPPPAPTPPETAAAPGSAGSACNADVAAAWRS